MINTSVFTPIQSVSFISNKKQDAKQRFLCKNKNIVRFFLFDTTQDVSTLPAQKMRAINSG